MAAEGIDDGSSMDAWVYVAMGVGALLLIVLLVRAVRLIPQSTVAIVERFGRYTRTLNAGPHLVLPFADRIRFRVDLREQVVPFPPQPALTRDNREVTIGYVVSYQVTDPRAATYAVANYLMAIEQFTTTTLRGVVAGMDLERVLASRDEIGTALHGALREAAFGWGIRLNRLEVKEIEPPAADRAATERRLRAGRERQVEATRADPGVPTPRRTARADDHAETTPPPAAPGVEPPEPLRANDPRRVGRYALRARLGEGGMGTVYLGATPGGRLLAVKVLRASVAGEHRFRERFAREVEAARRVGGFYAAQLVDADPEAEPPWLATEYIPGPTLREVLRRHGPLPARSLQALAAGTAEALAAIHACGIIHRDLKPGNIIVSEAGPRVIDFGIARSLDSSTALTATHHVIGTAGFLAPEQLTGGTVTFAADVYALGVVLCHAASGGDTGEPLATALDMLPSALRPLVTRCLDHDPARRPTAARLTEELTDGGAGEDVTAEWLPPALRTLVDFHARTTASVVLPD